MLGNFKLATKFTLLLSLVFLGTILISGITLSKALEQRAEDEVNYRGQVLIQMMNSVRDYTNNHISPLLASTAEQQSQFTPEIVPSFSAREVFENLRSHKEYANFLYKDATINPTNLRDRADEFESNLIEKFRQDPKLESLSGFRDLFGEQLFYSSRPFAIKEQSCLRCHSTPDQAPKSQVATYGTENGFNWKLNEILGTQIIYIPASKVFENARQTFSLVIGIFILIFALVILAINYSLKRDVLQPIRPMAKLAEKISMNTIDAESEGKDLELTKLAVIAKRTDELGKLGKVFYRMVHEIQVREQAWKKQMEQLRVQIDQAKKHQEVEEIANLDYFQKLHAEAKDIRNKWSDTDTTST
ncbi:c-type heme family protein [Calothrix sp. NIES-2098]|uniref:c-type heme family protein n=1 Tax=Calothrix sp. NIES-2098 TaxID=1954171 RepID=UPI000B5EF2D1|nr:sensor protein [Calothrix sp. NIES-2098]